MNANIEVLSDARSLITVKCRGYVIQMQDLDLDPSAHGGLNLLTAGGLVEPVREILADGAPVFVVQNTTQVHRDGEVGWLIVAPDFASAVGYAMGR